MRMESNFTMRGDLSKSLESGNIVKCTRLLFKPIIYSRVLSLELFLLETSSVSVSDKTPVVI